MLGILAVAWLVVCLPFLPLAYLILSAFKVFHSFSKAQEDLYYFLCPLTMSLTMVSCPPSILASMLLLPAYTAPYSCKEEKAKKERNWELAKKYEREYYAAVVLCLLYSGWLFLGWVIALTFLGLGYVFMGICYFIARKQFHGRERTLIFVFSPILLPI